MASNDIEGEGAEQGFDRLDADAAALVAEMTGGGPAAVGQSVGAGGGEGGGPAAVATVKVVAMWMVPIRGILERLVPPLAGAPADAWGELNEPIAELLDFYEINVGSDSPWMKLAAASLPIGLHALGRVMEAKEAKAGKESGEVQAAEAKAEGAGDAPKVSGGMVVSIGK